MQGDRSPVLVIHRAAWRLEAYEALAYADRLRQAGVPTESRLHRGLVHGYANAVGVGRVAPTAMRELAQALRAGLADS